jgi:tetratricopeptide (TPR) repeat protein
MIFAEKNNKLYASTLVAAAVAALIFFALACHRQAEPAPATTVASNPDSSRSKLSEADQLYRQREDLDKLRRAITMVRQARTDDYGSYEAAWKLSKYDYYLGAHTKDDDERTAAFKEGIDVGKIAVQLQGDKPDGHFWLGANYGGDAEHSTLAGLASVNDIRQEMETVLKLDEGYGGGLAYLGLGKLYSQAPRALGGDNQKAIEYLEKGLKVGKNNTAIMVTLAKAYHSENRDGEAQKLINNILTMTPDPEYVPEYKESVEQAKKLKDDIARANP